MRDGGQPFVWFAAAGALALGACLECHKKVLVFCAEDFLRSLQGVFARPAKESSELALRENSGQCAPQNARPPRNKESRPGGHWAPAAARPSGRLGLLRGCAWSFSRLMLERNCEHRGRREGYANAAGQRHTRTDKEGRARSVEAPQLCGWGGFCRAWLNCS
jgi:hypothetical protein